MKTILYSLVALLFFTSCEKIIEIDLKENQSKIVIVGNITNEVGPYFVKITKSSLLNYQGENATIDNAVVTIRDNQGNTEMLSAIGNGNYQTTKIRGKVGLTYTLVAKIGGETYTAQSTMPALVKFDSIKVLSSSFGGEISYDFVPVFTDPIAKGNQYRFVLSLNDKLVKLHFVLDDLVKNGSVNTQPLQNMADLKIKTGDVVKLQMQSVDDNVGLYYKTLVQITDSGPGGGTTPSNPPNNISNGALGIFSAHTIQEKSTTIK
jgi:hypothetical protein